VLGGPVPEWRKILDHTFAAAIAAQKTSAHSNCDKLISLKVSGRKVNASKITNLDIGLL